MSNTVPTDYSENIILPNSVKFAEELQNGVFPLPPPRNYAGST